MKAHKSYVKKFTCFLFFAVLCSIPCIDSLCKNVVDQVVDMYYQDIANQSTIAEEQAQVKETEEEVPQADEESQGKSILEDAGNELPW